MERSKSSEIAGMNYKRAVNDSELVRRGAEYDEKGVLKLDQSEIEDIKRKEDPAEIKKILDEAESNLNEMEKSVSELYQRIDSMDGDAEDLKQLKETLHKQLSDARENVWQVTHWLNQANESTRKYSNLES